MSPSTKGWQMLARYAVGEIDPYDGLPLIDWGEVLISNPFWAGLRCPPGSACRDARIDCGVGT